MCYVSISLKYDFPNDATFDEVAAIFHYKVSVEFIMAPGDTNPCACGTVKHRAYSVLVKNLLNPET